MSYRVKLNDKTVRNATHYVWKCRYVKVRNAYYSDLTVMGNVILACVWEGICLVPSAVWTGAVSGAQTRATDGERARTVCTSCERRPEAVTCAAGTLRSVAVNSAQTQSTQDGARTTRHGAGESGTSCERRPGAVTSCGGVMVVSGGASPECSLKQVVRNVQALEIPNY